MQTTIILFTGGTIAMRSDEHGRLLPACSGEDLLIAIPELSQIAQIHTQQLCNVASAHLTSDIWLDIRAAILSACAHESVAGVVLVQGTDSMEETAFFLAASLTLEQLHNKPVVLTGAMRSNDEPESDGAINLLNAVRISQADSTRNLGVVVSMSGRIHAARNVRKIHTSETDAFVSIGTEPLGVCHPDGHINIFAHSPNTFPAIFFEHTQLVLPEIAIVSTHIGANPQIIRFFISTGCAALVIQGLGAGNVSVDFAIAIEHALAQNIPVVITSRSPKGKTAPIYGYVGGGQYLVERGAVMAGDLPAHKARIFLQLLLAQSGATQNPLRIVANGFATLDTSHS